jgi:O-antigen/teichoic acid export membrane protein
MAVPKPVVGMAWVLMVIMLAVSIWSYSGVIIGVAFLAGAIVMSVFWLVKDNPNVVVDSKNNRRAGVILVMAGLAVAIWLVAAPGFGLFFGASAVFGYIVGQICSKYAGDNGHNDQ